MDAQPIMTPFEMEQQRANRRSQEAVLTMWTGIGAILCLLLTCFLGSFWRTDARITCSVAVMVFLLIVSLILFFTATKRDQRWYVVCSLINHAGIGLAVLILLYVLGLEIRLKQLALSGLPSAAILFGVVVISAGLEGDSRDGLLTGGAVVFGLAVLAALLKFSTDQTEFWLCTAICALLSCVNLCALIWTSKEPDRRSIFKALAVVSFGVYILLAVAAVAAFAVAVLGNSDRDSKSTKKLFGASKRGKSSGGGSIGSGSSGGASLFGGSLGSGASASSGSVPASGLGTGYTTGRRAWVPRHLWYYSLYHGSPRSRYRSDWDAAEDLPVAERQALDRRARRRRWIIFCVVVVIVILLIALAVYFGRG